jgi:hypothetical protein
MGIDDNTLENITGELMSMFGQETEEEEESDTATFPFLENVFGQNSPSQMPNEERKRNRHPEERAQA